MMPGGGWGDAECLGNIGRGGDTPGEPDKVTHVMRRERGERERGESGHRMRGEAEGIRHQELRLAVTTRGMRRGAETESDEAVAAIRGKKRRQEL